MLIVKAIVVATLLLIVDFLSTFFDRIPKVFGKFHTLVERARNRSFVHRAALS